MAHILWKEMCRRPQAGNYPACTAPQTEDGLCSGDPLHPQKGTKYQLVCCDEWGLNCQYFTDAPDKSLTRTGEGGGAGMTCRWTGSGPHWLSFILISAGDAWSTNRDFIFKTFFFHFNLVVPEQVDPGLGSFSKSHLNCSGTYNWIKSGVLGQSSSGYVW